MLDIYIYIYRCGVREPSPSSSLSLSLSVYIWVMANRFSLRKYFSLRWTKRMLENVGSVCTSSVRSSLAQKVMDRSDHARIVWEKRQKQKENHIHTKKEISYIIIIITNELVA